MLPTFVPSILSGKGGGHLSLSIILHYKLLFFQGGDNPSCPPSPSRYAPVLENSTHGFTLAQTNLLEITTVNTTWRNFKVFYGLKEFYAMVEKRSFF